MSTGRRAISVSIKAEKWRRNWKGEERETGRNDEEERPVSIRY